MNGADASTRFQDDSDYAHAVTAVGNAQIDTAQSKFGGASGLFDSVGDYLTVPDSGVFTIGGNDLSIDCWIRVPDLAGARTICSHGTDANNYMLLQKVADGISFDVYQSGSNIVTLVSGVVLTANTWHHIAVTRNGTAWKLWVGGVQAASDTDATSISNYTSTFHIGAAYDNSAVFDGHIDEFRFVNGQAAWSAAFTPPTGPYLNPEESSS